MNVIHLHEKAVSLAKTYKRSEAELLTVLVSLRESDGFRRLNYPNLFVYCTKGLILSEAQAFYFSRVVRKADEVPELIAAVQSGAISLSQARRVAGVITPETAPAWIEKAATLPQRELERAVTIANPKAVVREKIRPIAPTRSELRVGISVELEKRIERAQEVTSQAKKNKATLETTLEEMTAFYLEHKDPVEKAKRAETRKSAAAKKTSLPTKLPSGQSAPPKSPSSRKLTTAVRHELNGRDLGRCQAILPNGQRCGSSLWVEHHHILPKSLGGPNIPANLITLCGQHHKMQHLLS